MKRAIYINLNKLNFIEFLFNMIGFQGLGLGKKKGFC